MGGRTRWIRRRALALAVAALGVVAIAGTALAGHQTSGVKSYTGCLVSGDGVLIKIKEGNAPKSACSGGQVEAHFSGGDITKISVGSGLSLPNGGDNGEVRIELAAGQTLPQGCDTFEFPIKRSSGWVCADHEAGTGLVLGTSVATDGSVTIDYGIGANYRVKNHPDCPSGQFATGFEGDGDIQCAAPPTPTGLRAYSSTVGETILAGDTVVTSKDLPAGTYLLFASVALINTDGNANGDGYSVASCRIPGYSTNNTELVWPDEEFARSSQSVSLASAIVHGGGTVELRCEEREPDVDVFQATLTAIGVDSLG